MSLVLNWLILLFTAWDCTCWAHWPHSTSQVCFNSRLNNQCSFFVTWLYWLVFQLLYRRGGTYKVLKNLLKNKLLHHDSSKCWWPLFCITLHVLHSSSYWQIALIETWVDVDDGFRLTYLGYDFLAIKAMVNKGVFQAVGRQIGVGKESGIFLFSAYKRTTHWLKSDFHFLNSVVLLC